MTTATGQVAFNFAGVADGAYAPTEFTRVQGLTMRTFGGAVRGNVTSGFAVYNVAAPSAGATVSMRGETVRASTAYGDPRGFSFMTVEGNGYYLWINGDIVRFYKVTAFAATQMGDSFSGFSYAAGDLIEARAEYAAGTATLTLVLNGVDQAMVRTDSSAPYSVFTPGLMFEHDDGSNSGWISFAFDGVVAGPAIIDINSGGAIQSGSVNNTVTVSNFVSPPTSLVVGGLAMTALVNISGDQYSFTDPGFVDGEVDPGFGTLPAVASNTEETSAAFNVTRTLDIDLTAVVVGTLSTDPESIGQKLAGQLAIVATDTFYHAAGVIVYDDLTVSHAEARTHTMWHRAAATNVMTQVFVTIGASGVIGDVSVTGVTVVDVSVIGVTVIGG